MLKTKLPTKLKSKKQSRQQARMHEQIRNPQKLKLLVLSGSRLSSTDFTFMLRCKSLIKLDLSDNELSKLPQFFKLSEFPELKLVYLHKNHFKTLEDIRPVLECSRLIHITLHENPIYSNQLEHFLINVLRTLRMVNQRVVYEEERMESVVINKEHVKVNIDKLGIIGGQEGQEERIDNNKYIEGLDKQMEQIQRLWVNFNPLIKFQRIWRNRRLDKKTRRVLLSQKQKNKKKEQVEVVNEELLLLGKYFDLWRVFKSSLKKAHQILRDQNKNHLIYDQKRYLDYKRNQRINAVVKSFLARIREKVKKRKAVKVFQKHLSMKVVMLESEDCFYSVSGIEQSHRIIIATNQQVLLENILANVDKMMGIDVHHHYTIKPCKDYVSIRTVDSLRVQTVYNLYRMFLQPSMSCIFLKQKLIAAKNTPFVHINQLPHIIKSNTQLTPKQLHKITQVTNQITRYTQNQYNNSLLSFQCHNPQYFKMLLRLIYYHNTNCLSLDFKKPDLTSQFNFLNPFSNQLIFYIDKQLKRTTAAITIQNTWRRYWTGKTSTEIIAEIKRNRAAILVQHFYRGLEWKHRESFNKEIARHLEEFQVGEVVVQEEVYFGIWNLPVMKGLGENLTLWYAQGTVKIKGKYEKSVFNPTVLQHFERKLDVQKGREDKWSIADNYHLLHVGAEVSRITVMNKKYLLFKYQSLEQAKKRVAYLGLISYLYKQKGVFIKGLSRKMLRSEWIKTYESMIERNYKIKIQTYDNPVDRIVSIKNLNPYFLFPQNQIDYFDKQKQPEGSVFEVPLRIYHYPEYDEQPHKIDEKLIISLRYFKDKFQQPQPPQQQSIKSEPVFQPIQSSALSDCRAKQKLKKLNNTLKNLTAVAINDSPLQITKTYQQSIHKKKQKQQIEQKKSQVKAARETKRNNKLLTTEYRNVQLGKVKKWVQNQKNIVEISRTQKEQDEEQKRDKIRSASQNMRERRNSLQEKSQHEMQFVQKGNFLFKQYLKMGIMKDKRNDLQTKRASITKSNNRKVTMSEEKRGYTSMLDKSVSLMDRSYELRKGMEDSDILKSQRSGRESPGGKSSSRIQQISRTELLVAKPRVRKTKEHMVHGVFPEEFYAIEKKSLNLPKI